MLFLRDKSTLCTLGAAAGDETKHVRKGEGIPEWSFAREAVTLR